MSSEDQQQQQQQPKAAATTTCSNSQQEGSVTPATSAIKNSVKRVSIKGTPSRVKIAAPYAYVEVIGVVFIRMCMRLFSRAFVKNVFFFLVVNIAVLRLRKLRFFF